MEFFTPNPVIAGILVPVVAFVNEFLNRILISKKHRPLQDIDKVGITLVGALALTYASTVPPQTNDFLPEVARVLSGISTGLYAAGIYAGGKKILNAAQQQVTKDPRRP